VAARSTGLTTKRSPSLPAIRSTTSRQGPRKRSSPSYPIVWASWRIGLGVNYQLNNDWKLRFGTAYDKTPVQDAFRTPRLPDADRIWLALGAQWQFSKQGALDFGYAHEFVDDATSNLPSTDPAPMPGFPNTPKGALRGTYKANVNILGIQVKYSF